MREPEKACAGNQGTIISIEDLFHNMPQRKQGLKSPVEEFQKISDVVSKYAIHNSKVGFTLKKFNENPSVRTSPATAQVDNIRTIYGSQIAKEIVEIEVNDDVLMFRMKGLITKVDYAVKKGIYLFFINHRLVDCTGKIFYSPVI